MVCSKSKLCKATCSMEKTEFVQVGRKFNAHKT